MFEARITIHGLKYINNKPILSEQILHVVTTNYELWTMFIYALKHKNGYKYYVPLCYLKPDKQMFVKHLPPARSEYRVPQRPITKTGTKEGQLTQRYY